jgi:hypothetical protein
LFLLYNTELDRISADWERTRVQTWHLLNIQLDQKNKISYDKFKVKHWPFAWEQPEIQEIPVINWEEKDNRDKLRTNMAFKAETLSI